MKLKIVNLLGVKRAEFDLGGIVEVVGPNASGKSSLAACAQALLAHEQNPLGVPATQAARVYLRDGEDEGLAEIDGVEWRPGKGLTVTDGALPLSSPEAVGLVDYTARRGEKERLESLQSALLPDMSEIIDAVRERLLAYMPKQDVGGLLDVIGERGFDAAAVIYAERGREAKRQWQDIAGRAYGIKIASDWRPDGWLADMDVMTTQQAEEAVTAAREALATLHQVQAVTEAEAQQAAEAKASLPGLQATLQATSDEVQTIRADMDGLPLQQAEEAVTAAERELAIQRGITRAKKATLSCPHCRRTLSCLHCRRVVSMSSDGTLEQYDEEAARLVCEEAKGRAVEIEDQLMKLALDLGVLRKAVQGQQELLHAASDVRGEAKTSLAVAERLALQVGAEVDTADRRAGLMQAEQAVDDAKRTSGMVSAEARAAELSETIARYAEIVRALGPQGVRAQMMEVGLKRLNAGLSIIGREAIWPLVQVGGKGAVMWNGRPIQLCSASEQWRAQAAIQLTLAAMTGSQAVVLDRADMLDASNREGLVRAVKRVAGKTGIAVLLCSTGVVNGAAPWKQVAIEGGATR